MRTFKIVQKRFYDALSHRHAVILCLMGFVFIMVSAFHFGETALAWSNEKYQAVFNTYRDNLAQSGFQRLLCQYVPIDAVYTWVNGTDPKLISELFKTRHKLAKDLNLTIAREPQCTYSHCVGGHLLLVQPVLARSVTFDDLEDAEPLLGNVSRHFRIQSTKQDQMQNFTVLVFTSPQAAKDALSKEFFRMGSRNFSMSMAYLTDDWMAHTAVLLQDVFILTGVPPGHSQEEVQDLLPRTVQEVFMYPEKSMGIISLKNPMQTLNLTFHNLTMDKKQMKILPAYLVLESLAKDEDASSNRFADNEELRYSLRSLEKHAPWIRHVYLVTNGQIPSWLNLDNPRLTIVTHQELFRNQSHLPTFSSPAIEVHLHRIPGLSQKFLYLNDDVFLGKDVWPEDFYSHSKGYKVYLSWPVPDCSEGCPTSWIRDGYCDKTCNNSDCDWDGGDCTGDNVKYSYPQQTRGNYGMVRNAAFMMEDLDKMYCNPSCANSWLADRYCDQACNAKDCGFDAGDCGTDNFRFLHQIPFEAGNNYYKLPAGVLSAYLNLSSLGLNGSSASVQSGTYEDNAVVRVVTVSIKYAVLSLVFQVGHGPLNISVTLSTEDRQVNFDLGVDTRQAADASAPVPDPTLAPVEEEIPIAKNVTLSVVTRYPPHKWFPIRRLNKTENHDDEFSTNISYDKLPSEVLNQIEHIKLLYHSGILTGKGYLVRHSKVIIGYLRNLTDIPQQQEENLTPKHVLQRHLLWTNENGQSLQTFKDLGFLPWEKSGFFSDIEKALQSQAIQKSYVTSEDSRARRHLLDTFGDSLRHVNKLYNGAFGYEARKVPAHMAHLVDVQVMTRLQDRFPDAFDVTSSHKIRSPSDMQFAFSYFYYLMSEMENVSVSEIFDLFDTDASGTWSDREIRTLLTRVEDLPLQFSNVMQFEDAIQNCSLHAVPCQEENVLEAPPGERYADSKLPTVTKALVTQCDAVLDKLLERFGRRSRNRFELRGEEEVSFKMLHSNLSIVLNLLDEIRKTPKKFICLNDNVGHGTKEAEIIQAVLKDFYESLFPKPSQFELPLDYRNRFLSMEELQQWRHFRGLVKLTAAILLVALLVLVLAALCMPERFLLRSCRLRPHRRKLDV